MRVLRVVVCAVMLPAGIASAQDAAAPAPTTEVTITATRSLDPALPYTLFYPAPMLLVEDGEDYTIATLEYPGTALHCDAMIGQGGAPDWSAETAAATLDRAGTEAAWLEQFPGFAISTVETVNMQSGPAMFYEGASQNSPFGVPTTIFHAEAVDGGRTYIYECLADTTIAPGVKGLVNFLFANFSTRSDGECCVDPAVKE
jgi:hypothetical protein